MTRPGVLSAAHATVERMNFTITFTNGATGQYFGDTDSYTISDGGVLILDVHEDGRRVRRTYPPTAWLEVLNRQP
jgi:hypothetical protein